MDLKIQCPCGQKIAFDVEPENGAMPCALPCPTCQTDVTDRANEQIREQLTAATPTVSPAAPARMRISMGATAHTVEPSAIETATSPSISRGWLTPVAPSTKQGADGESTIGVFLLGTVGVLGGAAVGVIVWFLISTLGWSPRILAVLVALGAGLGARVFCREGDKSLGGVAAVVAVIGMFFGGAITFDEKIRTKYSQSDKDMREAYAEAVKDAKLLVAEIPNGTDAEIVKFLGRREGGTDSIEPKDIQEFRGSDEYRDAKDLASGAHSFEAYARAQKQRETELHKEVGGLTAGIGGLRMLSIWLIALVGGTAYKLASG